MQKLQNKVKSLSTKMLIEVFKGLETIVNNESELVNNLVMDELELRLPEPQFISLIDEVYPD